MLLLEPDNLGPLLLLLTGLGLTLGLGPVAPSNAWFMRCNCALVGDGTYTGGGPESKMRAGEVVELKRRADILELGGVTSTFCWAEPVLSGAMAAPGGVTSVPSPSFGCCVGGGEEMAKSDARGVELGPFTDGGGDTKVVSATPGLLPTTLDAEARRSLEAGGEITFLPPLEPGYTENKRQVRSEEEQGGGGVVVGSRTYRADGSAHDSSAQRISERAGR